MRDFPYKGLRAFLTAARRTGRPVAPMTAAPSPFELAEAELRKLGLSISRLPGEYRVNFRNGAESTARTLETLDQALAAGRAMTAERGSRHFRAESDDK